jgi:2-polyprenyl-6-hydroxyphenyl methylase / 3-demethylubiquinone-9 3-methyltransferase
MAQEWKFTRLAPPTLHVWERFIIPDELNASLARHGLQNKDLVGTRMTGNPMQMILARRRDKAGKIAGAELGTHLGLQEGTN